MRKPSFCPCPSCKISGVCSGGREIARLKQHQLRTTRAWRKAEEQVAKLEAAILAHRKEIWGDRNIKQPEDAALYDLIKGGK